MANFLATHPDEPARDAISVAQARSLMEAAHADSRAAGRPCLGLSIDLAGLARQRRVHGEDAARRLLDSAADLLVGVKARGDLFALREGERLRVLLPGMSLHDAKSVAQDLLARAQTVGVETGDRTAWLSLAIGVAHDGHLMNATLETLNAVADRGAAVADAGGGNRWAHTELYDLVQEGLKARSVEFVPSPRAGSMPRVPDALRPTPAPAALPAEEADPLAELLRETLRAAGGGDLGRAKVVSAARGWVAEERRRTEHEKDGEHHQRLDQLERRIQKLLDRLEKSEERVQELEGQRSEAAGGVASAYDAVQGLQEGAEHFALKKALMARLLEENLALREKQLST